ncbi:MAG: M16 family metallopeptidase, partial [Caulobacteraceae bacterium]
AQTAANWPYLDFGEPTKVVERKDVLDLGTVFIRFANGVVLTVKPTKFRDDEVDVEVRAGDGLESLSPKTQDMAWAGYALTEGGFGKLSAEDAERALAAQVWGANFRVQEDAFALIGTTTRDDLTTELQALAAYLTDPGWRPAGLERVKAYASTLQDQEEHSDTGVLNLDLPGLLHDGDERWTFPSRSEIAAASLDQLKAQVAPFFTSPIEVVIVGDITVEEAIDAAERTFGALAPRVPSASSKVISPRFPAPSPQPVILRHKGRADQAIAVEAWPTQGFYESPRQAREMAILGEVLQIRLRDKLRLSESMTYSPTVSYDASVYWPNWGFIDAVVEAPPAKLSKVFANIETIAQKLSSDLVTPDELERAKKPKIDAVEKAQATNAYWLAALAGAQADPRRLTVIRSEIAGLERVTAEDVRDAARRWLTPSKAWKLEILPSSSS